MRHAKTLPDDAALHEMAQIAGEIGWDSGLRNLRLAAVQHTDSHRFHIDSIELDMTVPYGTTATVELGDRTEMVQGGHHKFKI